MFKEPFEGPRGQLAPSRMLLCPPRVFASVGPGDTGRNGIRVAVEGAGGPVQKIRRPVVVRVGKSDEREPPDALETGPSRGIGAAIGQTKDLPRETGGPAPKKTLGSVRRAIRRSVVGHDELARGARLTDHMRQCFEQDGSAIVDGDHDADLGVPSFTKQRHQLVPKFNIASDTRLKAARLAPLT